MITEQGQRGEERGPEFIYNNKKQEVRESHDCQWPGRLWHITFLFLTEWHSWMNAEWEQAIPLD